MIMFVMLCNKNKRLIGFMMAEITMQSIFITEKDLHNVFSSKVLPRKPLPALVLARTLGEFQVSS